MSKKTYFNWSSGKDSAMALHALLQSDEFTVDYLLTSVNDEPGRVTMHGLRETLLEMQLDAIGIRHGVIRLPDQPSNDEYERVMTEKVTSLKSQGFECAAFGDIFLEDLKSYRESQLRPYGIDTAFPLWKRDTRELMREFVALGFKAVVICIDASKLDASFLGRVLDTEFVSSLPQGVDACGENGEFHTFCFDAPFFKNPIRYSIGETVYRQYEAGEYEQGFWYCDLVPL
ncbi:Dph6-related ATP pyrophosphatase [Flavobacterium selenitireducens]|uniref:Dph6-related ATP pyrophosphatase n=1 Tax=Flavobacterium selenitireducens TaxID=2722704 RepID=UPI00168A5343|nr:diphthine--ammonia ligase [Flavobacterium selenitireducens]MBD3581907.1 diphthine--ammonia ligase [Flavobacterium selenitireducens]